MVKIDVVDKKVIIEKHRDDVTNYQKTVKDLMNVIDKLSDYRLETGEGREIYKIFQSNRITAEFIPLFSGKERALSELRIELYNEKILSHIKKAIHDNLDKCKGLEKVTIQTYF